MIISAVILILCGVLVKHGKMYFLLAGYNTMSKEERKQYDISGIATLFRNVMFGMALVIIAGHFAADWLKNPGLENIAMYASILIGLPYLIIKANSKKYKKTDTR